MESNKDIIAEFCKERDAILRSLDIHKYEKFLIKNGTPIPIWKHPTVPLASMHKARLHIVNFSEQEKEESRKWLTEHNYSHDI